MWASGLPMRSILPSSRRFMLLSASNRANLMLDEPPLTVRTCRGEGFIVFRISLVGAEMAYCILTRQGGRVVFDDLLLIRCSIPKRPSQNSQFCKGSTLCPAAVRFARETLGGKMV